MATYTVTPVGDDWSDPLTCFGQVSHPTAADAVVMNASSGNNRMNRESLCRSFDCTGFTGTFTHGIDDDIYILKVGDGTVGHFTLSAGMTYTSPPVGSYLQRIEFWSTVAGNQLTLAGQTLHNIWFSGAGGSWTYQDDLTSIGQIHLASGIGTVDTNGKTVQSASALISGGNLTLGATVWRLTSADGESTWNVLGDATINAGTSTIWLIGTGAEYKEFLGGGKTYYDLKFTVGGSGPVQIGGSNTFHAIVKSGTGTKTLEFQPGTTQTLTGATAVPSGSTGNLLILRGWSAATWTLNLNGQNLTAEYLNVKNLSVTNGTLTLTNSTDGGGNNANVIFSEPPAGSSGSQSLHLRLGLGL